MLWLDAAQGFSAFPVYLQPFEKVLLQVLRLCGGNVLGDHWLVVAFFKGNASSIFVDVELVHFFFRFVGQVKLHGRILQDIPLSIPRCCRAAAAGEVIAGSTPYAVAKKETSGAVVGRKRPTISLLG